MKILIYTQWCNPEPAFKSIPFARALQLKGHDVRVITGFPNYPGGRIYPQYHLRPWLREKIEGIPIFRCPLYPSHDRSSIRRALNYSSFACSSVFPLLIGWKPDVVYVYNLVTLGALARINGWLRNVPYVLDVQDLWPDSIFQCGMGAGWMNSPLEGLCRFAYRGADRVVVQSPGFKQELVSRGLTPEKVEVIYNWADQSVIGEHVSPKQGSPDEVARLNGRFNILYAGNLGAAQALETAIQASAITAEKDPRIQWVFVGRGVCKDALESLASRLAPRSTLFLAPRSQRAMNPIVSMSQVLLVSLCDSPLFSITIPSKIQGAMAAGRPILGAVSGDAAKLVETARAGLLCEPGKPRMLAEAAIKLAGMDIQVLDSMGMNGRRFYTEKMSIERGVSRFESVFQDVYKERLLSK